jgi:hypothetical protein
MSTETKAETSTPPPPVTDGQNQELFRPQIVKLLDQKITNVKDIAHTVRCSQALVRNIKKQWVTDRLKAIGEAKAKQATPTGEPNIEFETKKPTQETIPIDLLKAALDESEKTGFKKPPQCPRCHQPFRGTYAECPECHRTVIPDTDILSKEDFKDILTAILNTVFTKLGAKEMTQEEIDRGAQCFARLAQKYRVTLFGFIPEIMCAVWGITVILPRVGQMMDFLKNRPKKPQQGQQPPVGK